MVLRIPVNVPDGYGYILHLLALLERRRRRKALMRRMSKSRQCTRCLLLHPRFRRLPSGPAGQIWQEKLVPDAIALKDNEGIWIDTYTDFKVPHSRRMGKSLPLERTQETSWKGAGLKKHIGAGPRETHPPLFPRAKPSSARP